MKIALISLENLDDTFRNGFVQNVKLLIKLLENMTDIELIKITSSSEVVKLLANDKLFSNTDIILQITPFDTNCRNIIKKHFPNSTLIHIKYGHDYYNTLHSLLWNASKSTAFSCEQDEIWISPHFESTRSFYECLLNAKSKILPFLWEPIYIDRLPFKDSDMIGCEKNIYIVEPNIDNYKTSLIPMMIVNEVWKKTPDKFNKVFVIGYNNYQKNETFNDVLLPHLEVFHGHNNKGYFSSRATFNEIFKSPGILLSHQENCGLNYIYLEAIYMGIPWVHNSPYFKGDGYYYNDKDICEGAKQLEIALDEFKLKHNHDLIESFSCRSRLSEYKQMFIDSCKTNYINTTL